MSTGWIGVDLDGTLAEYHGWVEAGHIGAPVMKMVNRVQAWLRNGTEVRIVTARVADDPTGEIEASIARWCVREIGQRLPVTNCKDFGMIELWDDRAVGVVPNTGVPVGQRDI